MSLRCRCQNSPSLAISPFPSTPCRLSSEVLDVVFGIRNQHLFVRSGRLGKNTRRGPIRKVVAGAELVDVATDQRALRSGRQSRSN